MNDREERLLLSVLEGECERADLIVEKWKAMKIEDYDGDDDGLAYEVAFADGVANAWASAKNLIERTINA